MLHFSYIFALVFSIVGLLIADWRYKLAFFADHNRAVRAIVGSLCFFVLWDAVGIVLRIFYTGSNTYISQVFLAPEFPLEEIFFLLLLSYSTLVIWRGLQKL